MEGSHKKDPLEGRSSCMSRYGSGFRVLGVGFRVLGPKPRKPETLNPLGVRIWGFWLSGAKFE